MSRLVVNLVVLILLLAASKYILRHVLNKPALAELY